jgi:hypothetical protein
MGASGKKEKGLPPLGDQPGLTVVQILEWAEAHLAERGKWPTWRSGRIRRAPGFETWERVNDALVAGRRGLPGGRSLARLLGAYRVLRESSETEGADLREKYARMEGGEEKARPPLSVEQILKWADAYFDQNGYYPRKDAGPVLNGGCETWNRINTALRFGFRGLPGGTTLKRLLAEHRGLDTRCNRPEVSIAQILTWADAFHQAQGKWPNEASGPVADAPPITWGAIGRCLRKGGRGLPGGMTLRALLIQHRGVPAKRQPPLLSVAQILAWADSFHATHSYWPNAFCGLVARTRQETWSAIDRALRRGERGLPGGSSLARLLAEQRRARKRSSQLNLTVEEILAWADAHHAATGAWPTTCCGPVLTAPGRDWGMIDSVLRQGRSGLSSRRPSRELPRGSSLSRLLREHARVDSRKLTVETILTWADAHYARTGRWPHRHSGPVAAAPGEKWVNIDQALLKGGRGLAAGSSLARLLTGRVPPSVAR